MKGFKGPLNVLTNVNEMQLGDNCYYCCIAATLKTTFNNVLHESGVPHFGPALPDRVCEIYQKLGRAVRLTTFANALVAGQQLATMGELEFAVFGYNRVVGAAHMVIVQRQHGTLVVYDFQKPVPVLAKYSFPNELTLGQVWVITPL